MIKRGEGDEKEIDRQIGGEREREGRERMERESGKRIEKDGSRETEGRIKGEGEKEKREGDVATSEK
jgi:hypothetical protein